MACSLHVVAARTNTYAAPALTIPPGLALMAPTTAVSPEIETEEPKWSEDALSLAVSLACSLHVVPPTARTNTYADPASDIAPELAKAAPTTAVSPEREIEMPNLSEAALSLAVSLACSVHVVPPTARTNTYAAPASDIPPELAKGAPTTAVFPEIETEPPK